MDVVTLLASSMEFWHKLLVVSCQHKSQHIPVIAEIYNWKIKNTSNNECNPHNVSILKVMLYIDMVVNGVSLKITIWWKISLDELILFRLQGNMRSLKIVLARKVIRIFSPREKIWSTLLYAHWFFYITDSQSSCGVLVLKIRCKLLIFLNLERN